MSRLEVRRKSQQAAALYLDEQISASALSERLGITRGAIYTAVKRLRAKRGITGPRSA